MEKLEDGKELFRVGGWAEARLKAGQCPVCYHHNVVEMASVFTCSICRRKFFAKPFDPAEKPKMAWLIYSDFESEPRHKCVGYCEEDEAQEFCSRPVNDFNYVSNIGYRLIKDDAENVLVSLALEDWLRGYPGLVAGLKSAKEQFKQ